MSARENKWTVYDSFCKILDKIIAMPSNMYPKHCRIITCKRDECDRAAWMQLATAFINKITDVKNESHL